RRLEVRHVVVAITKALRLAKTDAVYDARVIQLVADHRVLFAEQRLEQAAVGVEAAAIKDGRVGLEKRRERRLESRVHALRAADEAHRRHPEPVAREAVPRRAGKARIVGEPEVIAGAEIDDPAPALELDLGGLRA